MVYDPRNKTSKFKDYFLPGAILLGGILISIGIFANKNGLLEKSAPGAILPINTIGTERVDINIKNNDPTLGNPTAKVVLVEFFDFQCGYCKAFSQQSLPKIINDYVKSGKVKIIFKDFAVLGEDSVSTAVAANCANEQNKFLEYHDRLYGLKNKNESFTEENLLAIATQLNLNVFKFNECIGLGKNVVSVDDDTRDGKLSGVKGTPTIFINGLKISGAQNYYYYKTIIDAELKNSGQ